MREALRKLASMLNSMTIEEFLKQQQNKFNSEIMCANSYGLTKIGVYTVDSTPQIDWLKDHDTRLINFILDKVEEEIENKENLVKNGYEHSPVYFDKDDVLTIINQLRIK